MKFLDDVTRDMTLSLELMGNSVNNLYMHLFYSFNVVFQNSISVFEISSSTGKAALITTGSIFISFTALRLRHTDAMVSV